MVGAFGVGRMTASFTDVVTNTGGAACAAQCSPPVPFDRGEEVGVFHLGSTVILVFDGPVVEWSKTPGDHISMGERIGTLLPLAP
jgi:phosphatidylserine decarboxylase